MVNKMCIFFFFSLIFGKGDFESRLESSRRYQLVYRYIFLVT